MGKKNPLEKKNKKKVDKLGKGKKAAANATQTSFKTAKINVSTPIALKSKDDITNNRNLTLSDLIAKLRHHKDASRSDALDNIRTFLTEQPHLLKSKMHAILESVLGSSSDLHSSVRSSFLKMMEFLFSETSPSSITPFLPLIIAYVSHTITHDIPVVQTDGLRFFKLLTSHYPQLLASPEFSSQLLPKLTVLMIQRFKEAKSRTADLQDTSSSSSSSSQNKSSKAGKESALSLLVEVLYIYLGLCITSARGGEKKRGRAAGGGITDQNSTNFELRETVDGLLAVAQRETKEGGAGDVMEWETLGPKPLRILEEGGEGNRWEGGGGMKGVGVMGCCYSRSAVRVSGSTSLQRLGGPGNASSGPSPSSSSVKGAGGRGEGAREGTMIESLTSVSLNAIAGYESKIALLNSWEFSWTLCLVDILFAHWVEGCPNEVVMALVNGVGEAGDGKRQRNVRISYFLTMILRVLNLFVELWTLEVGKEGKKLDEATKAALGHLLKSTEKHIIPLFPFRADKRGDSVIGMALFDLNLEGGRLVSGLIHLLGWVGKGGKIEEKGRAQKQKRNQQKNTFANSAVSPAPLPTPKTNKKGVPFSWVTKMGVFIHNIFQNELKKPALPMEINNDGNSTIRFFRTPEQRCAVSLGLLIGFLVKVSGEGVEEEELRTLRGKVLEGFSSYFKERQLVSIAKGMALCVVEWVFHNYAVVWEEGEGEEKVLVDWILYLPKLLYQLGQGMSRPSSSPASYIPLLERLIRLLHYLCSRKPATSSSEGSRQISLFSLSQTHISTLQTALVPFLFVMSPKHGGGLLGPFLDLTPELQTSFLSLLYYLPSFDGNMLKALAAVCGLSDNTNLRYGNIVFVIDLLLSRASSDKNGLASFFSFLTTVIMERSNPEESSLPLPQKAKKRKRDPPPSPPSPHVDKSLITLFSNSLCSLSTIPHSQTLLLLEGSAALILQSNKHAKSKSAMIALLGAFLNRVQPTSSSSSSLEKGGEEEKKLAISEGFSKTLLGAMKVSLMYLHSLSSSHAGEGGERGWEGKSGEGQWGWEMCVRVFCYNEGLLAGFLRLVEKEARELVQGGRTTQSKKQKTDSSSSSSSSSVLELDELLSCVTHIVSTPLLHSRLRDCTEDCEKFSKAMTAMCDSSSLSSLILSLKVALGKDSLGE